MIDPKYSGANDILKMFSRIMEEEYYDINIDFEDETINHSSHVDFSQDDGIIDVDYEVINSEKRAGHGVSRRLISDR